MLNPTEKEALVDKRASTIIAKNRTYCTPHSIFMFGFQLSIMPEVFSPAYGEGSKMLGEYLRNWKRREQLVLDMGTGSGLLAILAADFAEKVIATDIYYNACSCARNNVEKRRLGKKITVRQGDLFDAVSDEKKFSLIIFNPPFMGTDIKKEQDTSLLRAMYDPGYRTLRAFFSQVKSHLADNGKILLAFSNCGSVDLLEDLIADQEFSAQRIVEEHNGLEFYVYEIGI